MAGSLLGSVIVPGSAATPHTAAASLSYPVQEFRFGIGDTNRNLIISCSDSGDYLCSATETGERTEKWYLNYISNGVYEIVNSATGYVVTNESGLATIAPDTDAANQRWKIESVQNDFEGYALYYKVVSNADGTALTFDADSNSVSVDAYSGSLYQKYKLNLDGLEGYAANAVVGGKEKACTIGGLLGETVFASTTAELIAALDRTDPVTVVVTANLDLVNQGKDKQRIRDNKTLVGSYGANTIYDCQLRNDDFNGKDASSQQQHRHPQPRPRCAHAEFQRLRCDSASVLRCAESLG